MREDVRKIRRALISVSDKSGLIELADFLHARRIELISTGGTATAIRAAKLPVQDVSDLTGFPECFDGRVKTLHPKVHGGLLFKRGLRAHEETARELSIGTIDLVVVNLYPFAQTIANPGVTLDDAIEQVDIGGPAMIRSAAKNNFDVAVVVDPSQYGTLTVEIRKLGGTSLALRRSFAVKAFELTSSYDTIIAQYLRSHFRT